MLHALVQVKETARSFEEGDINLRDAISRMAWVLSSLRAT